MCKTKPDSVFGQFCHYTLVHVPSVTQEITKDKQKKTINLHNYFNILFLNTILVTFVLIFPLIFIISPSGDTFLCMYVSYVQEHRIRLLLFDSCVARVRGTGVTSLNLSSGAPALSPASISSYGLFEYQTCC